MISVASWPIRRSSLHNDEADKHGLALVQAQVLRTPEICIDSIRFAKTALLPGHEGPDPFVTIGHWEGLFAEHVRLRREA
jgi:hypothetical protein